VILYSTYQLAYREYENSTSLTKQKQEIVQRGIFDRARKDLQEAIREKPVLASASHVKKILNILQEEHNRVREAS
jgi:hypothetical protein